MITEWIKKHILEWLKDYPKYFLPFGLFSVACLFLPDSILRFIGLLDIRDQFKPYLGAAFILSCSFILSNIIITITTWIREKYRKWFFKRRVLKRLKQITPEEASILLRYIQNQTYTQSLSRMSGIVNGLANNGIIYQSSTLTRDPRGGRVCLDNLKQFLSDKLPRFMPLPASEVV